MKKVKLNRTNDKVSKMSELGRYGGKRTLKKYGTDHFKKMVERRWKKLKVVSETPDTYEVKIKKEGGTSI